MKHGAWIVFSIIHFLLNISLLTSASNGTQTSGATPTLIGIGGILAGIIIVLVLILVAAVWIIILKYKSTK